MEQIASNLSQLREQLSTLRVDAENLRADSASMVESLWEVFSQVNHSAEAEAAVKYRTFIRTQSSDYERSVRGLTAEYKQVMQSLRRRSLGLKQGQQASRNSTVALLQAHQAELARTSVDIIAAVQTLRNRADTSECALAAAVLADEERENARLAIAALHKIKERELQQELQAACDDRHAAKAVQEILLRQAGEAAEELRLLHAQSHAQHATLLQLQAAVQVAQVEKGEAEKKAQEVHERLSTVMLEADTYHAELEAARTRTHQLSSELDECKADKARLMQHAQVEAAASTELLRRTAEVHALEDVILNIGIPGSGPPAICECTSDALWASAAGKRKRQRLEQEWPKPLHNDGYTYGKPVPYMTTGDIGTLLSSSLSHISIYSDTSFERTNKRAKSLLEAVGRQGELADLAADAYFAFACLA